MLVQSRVAATMTFVLKVGTSTAAEGGDQIDITVKDIRIVGKEEVGIYSVDLFSLATWSCMWCQFLFLLY